MRRESPFRRQLRRVLVAGLRGLRGLEDRVATFLLSWRLSVSGFTLRRRLERLERLQQRLRGRLVAVTAAAELASRRGDELDPAASEREALRASLARLSRAVAQVRVDRELIRCARLSAASSQDTARSVQVVAEEVQGAMAAGPGRFDAPAWEARHRLGAGARGRASLAALRAGSGLLELREELRDPRDTLGELGGLGEQ